MSIDSEYYRMHRSNVNDIPLLVADKGCPTYLSSKKLVENPATLLFTLGSPIPKSPIMADYHSSPKSIISKKIYDILKDMNLFNVQLLPAKIRISNDLIIDDYWAIHICNFIQCVDINLSDCKVGETSLLDVKKIILDRKIMDSIPSAQRLVFRLKEDRAFQLVHKSIVQKIMDINPTGIKFTPIEDWHTGSFFEN